MFWEAAGAKSLSCPHFPHFPNEVPGWFLMVPAEQYGHDMSIVVSIAKNVLSGTIHPIEGTREICRIAAGSEYWSNAVFLPLRAIESETDHIPLGEMRAHCAGEYLFRMDKELEKFLELANDDIIQACGNIIQTFGD